eukprot:CAMPEP_0183761800 /NCGR_PEP_ID=MMETSP0739-20130205/8662_1 /TAXON_ID=385413 /ORGANISM="Thalassiosira miniscula, Strain CCMP1093" /LENGTH=102 /DNA_ID=CAMNT_0026000001 /DNA_START=376 /DNA_END=684 /DNA_ORIENTATION=-
MFLLPQFHPVALVRPRAIISADGDQFGKGGGEDVFEHLPNVFRLGGEGDDGDANVPRRGHWEEVEEERSNVLCEFGYRFFPSAAGVDVDHCLIEVDGEEVDF